MVVFGGAPPETIAEAQFNPVMAGVRPAKISRRDARSGICLALRAAEIQPCIRSRISAFDGKEAGLLRFFRALS